MSNPNNKSVPNKSEEKPTESLISATDFADLKGFNKVDRMAVSLKYRLEKKTKASWSSELSKSFIFN